MLHRQDQEACDTIVDYESVLPFIADVDDRKRVESEIVFLENFDFEFPELKVEGCK